MLPKRNSDSGSRYRDASEEVMRFFQKQKQKTLYGTEREDGIELLNMDLVRLENAITTLKMDLVELEDAIAIPIPTTPTITGAYGSSRYLLVQGCMLARQLQELEIEEKWKMISEVWIEILTYAAGHGEWRDHAQQLKSGGELLTHVRLLMAHLGSGQQYEEMLVN